ncbi:lasso peptide biosynthesis PqqD family chaperone [Streptomyces sp. XM4193]|uniref:lasso peptide biosynthesis PqqD family chaperone n=1 Tax=Streptomyces sp. XM4193 TaxID=2929782 RepID=UPI001FF97649|nr:lasso peptide biosynthesis PqqD family chaperone [Streptomyces sp. XM4193]MCK1794768.1 lasso peptide biosynthesis PqqD family chaperone [Streptomyces sp. XM4193]
MTLALAPDVSLVETDDTTVLLDEKNGRYWLLNHTGTVVLEHLREGRDVADAVALLCDQHPRHADRIPGDVEGLLAALRNSGLVVGA